ncbi:protein TAPT1 homolog [Tetranychus urticae]|uniref:Protein TAPT1 homolog n=1 Tax=Tetranychus urticae TaxID=32264 RepID=T1KZU0_TETUR|nr:protein TAPT1 homolog [Tetranychus urticae]
MSNIIINDDNEAETFIGNEEDKENQSYGKLVEEVTEIVKSNSAVKGGVKWTIGDEPLNENDSKLVNSGLRKRRTHSSGGIKDGKSITIAGGNGKVGIGRRISFAGVETGLIEPKVDYSWKNVTLYDYIHREIRRSYLPENDEARYAERREKFYMFLKIPRELERFIWFGFLQCVDVFVSLFTLLPIRFFLSLWFLLSRSMSKTFRKSTNQGRSILQPAEICDLLKGIMFIIGALLLFNIDTSMLYHIIKSQSVIKLYIFFNMLELADKLITSFGLDILDVLYWTATEPRGRKREHFGVIPHLFMTIVYIFVHAILVLLQATTLNVAINSSNNALLTIMMSNNFVELKGMVFKKFEKNNLFQMSCNDVKERFHLLIILIVVVIQTMKEYNWEEKHFWILMPYCFYIFISEFAVDWVKHCFVTRFNDISHEIYHSYTISLSYDIASSNLKSAYSDHTDLISKRMGFVPLPLGLLLMKVVYISVPLNGWYGIAAIAIGFLCLISFKFWLNILLVGRAFKIIEDKEIEKEKSDPFVRHCSSLPSSRHTSVENIPGNLEAPLKLKIINQTNS